MSPKRIFEHRECPSEANETDETPFLFFITLDRPKISFRERLLNMFTKTAKTPGYVFSGDRKWEEWKKMLETRYRTPSYVFRTYRMEEYAAFCLRRRLEEYGGEYGRVY